MPSVRDIFELLSTLGLDKRYGVAGSFARGTAKKSSDIDIVIDRDCMDIADMELIKKALKSKFSRKSDVICLELLKKEDVELDKLLCSIGLDDNEDSAYKSILREVIWCDEVI